MFRYPDKPLLSSHLVLPDLKDGEWIAQLKMDGWRCLIEVGEGSCTFTTRHNKPCPVSPAVAARTYEQLKHLPVRTILDSEWMERRAGDEERFWIFDVIRMGDVWWNDHNALHRIDALNWIIGGGDSTRLIPRDLIVPRTSEKYEMFFEASKQREDTEGIVLKHVSGTLKLSTRECYVNPMMLKVKYRDGADGKKRVA